jgi:hypothetical protein
MNLWLQITQSCARKQVMICHEMFNLKRKIIMGEYIDLALLLVNSQTAAAENQKLVFMKGENRKNSTKKL